TTGQTLFNSDVYYDASQLSTIIKAGTSSALRQYAFTLTDGDAGVGALQITVTTDYFNSVFEYDYGAAVSGHVAGEANNAASTTVTAVLGKYPDLHVANLAVSPATPQTGNQVTLTWNDLNDGTGDAAKSFYD